MFDTYLLLKCYFYYTIFINYKWNVGPDDVKSQIKDFKILLTIDYSSTVSDDDLWLFSIVKIIVKTLCFMV